MHASHIDDQPGRSSVGPALATFASLLADQHGATAILDHLVGSCSQLLPVHGVGILLREADGGLTVGTADTEAGRTVEELEVGLGEGPCTDALSTGEQVHVPDLAAARARYPAFVPRALDVGVGGIHALPLTHRTETLGAVDIITLEPNWLSRDHIATAQLLADVTVSFLVASRSLEDATTLARQLQHALDSRVVIEQAKGMLAERHGIDVETAFERLRGSARSGGRRLRDVAEEILRGDLEL